MCFSVLTSHAMVTQSTAELDAVLCNGLGNMSAFVTGQAIYFTEILQELSEGLREI